MSRTSDYLASRRSALTLSSTHLLQNSWEPVHFPWMPSSAGIKEGSASSFVKLPSLALALVTISTLHKTGR